MKKLIILLIASITILFSSCYTTQIASDNINLEEAMNSWKGKTKQQLLIHGGAPNSIISDGNGGEILTYKDVKRAYTYTYGYVTVIHTYTFYINREGIIYHVNYKREGRQGY